MAGRNTSRSRQRFREQRYQTLPQPRTGAQSEKSLRVCPSRGADSSKLSFHGAAYAEPRPEQMACTVTSRRLTTRSGHTRHRWTDNQPLRLDHGSDGGESGFCDLRGVRCDCVLCPGSRGRKSAGHSAALSDLHEEFATVIDTAENTEISIGVNP
jgi:hypothetical protein